MSESLQLEYPQSFGTSYIPSQQIIEHGAKLLELKNFRKRLQYYNKNICSLSFISNEGLLHIYGQANDDTGVGEIFFNAKVNDSSKLQTYFDERQREIDRLNKIISVAPSYLNKIKGLIENRVGQIRFNEPRVYSNYYIDFFAKGGGAVPDDLYKRKYEIKLEPNSPEEIETYNLYLVDYAKRIIANSREFHILTEVDYKGFLYTSAIEKFNKQLKRSFDKIDTINNEIKRIENHFSFRKITDYFEALSNQNIGSTEWFSALFNAILNGYEYDYRKAVLSMREVMQIIHVEQVVEYYKFIRKENLEKSILSELRKVNKSKASKSILNIRLSKEQLKKLCNRLIEKNYIHLIEENEFADILFGKADKKIIWKSSRRKLVYFLDSMCYSVSMPAANNCFSIKGKKKLDSNDRSKTGFQEIDALFKQI